MNSRLETRVAAHTDEEVQRVAKALIEKHGADAGHQANLSLIDVRRGGDAEIISWWRDVIKAIRRMQP